MVRSIALYIGETLGRALAALVLRLLRAKRPFVEEKPRREKPPSWGWFETANVFGAREYVFVGRYTNLRIRIPDYPSALRIPAYKASPPGERMLFTYSEVASKEWFKEMEALAEMLESRRVAGATGESE